MAQFDYEEGVFPGNRRVDYKARALWRAFKTNGLEIAEMHNARMLSDERHQAILTERKSVIMKATRNAVLVTVLCLVSYVVLFFGEGFRGLHPGHLVGLVVFSILPVLFWFSVVRSWSAYFSIQTNKEVEVMSGKGTLHERVYGIEIDGYMFQLNEEQYNAILNDAQYDYYHVYYLPAQKKLPVAIRRMLSKEVDLYERS